MSSSSAFDAGLFYEDTLLSQQSASGLPTKILVTGGAGFIGSKLVKSLVNRGATVTVVDNLWRGKTSNLEGVPGFNISTDLIRADLTSYDKCLAIFRNFDLVYHLADVVAGIDFVFSNEQWLFRENILINTNVLSACVENGIQKYVYVGTACSFPRELQGKTPGKIVALAEKKTYPASPESSYGWSKLMGEYEAELAQRSGKIRIGILRLHNVYGAGAPYADRAQALPALCRKIIRGEPYIVYGSGDQYRDFLHVDDVVHGLLRMPEYGLNKGVIQIGTGRAVRIKEAALFIAKLGEEILGKKTKPVFDTSLPEGDFGRVAVLDRAKSILGWEPQIKFEDGVRSMFQWILRQENIGHKVLPALRQMSRNVNDDIPQMAPWTDEKESEAVYEYMRSGGYLTQFKKTKAFEKMIADYVGAKHCFVVTNGTDSLKLMLVAVGVGPGDEVIVPNWTMAATAFVVSGLGATPVFVDVDESGCIDIDLALQAISKSTKAIFHVSMNARCNDIARLASECKARGIPLLEDSAQALGSYYKGKHLGTYGSLGSFSFSPPKIITTGQGGAVVTNDDALAIKISKLKDFGRIKGGIDIHDIIGWNHKFTDIQATVGIEQMKKLPWRVGRMKEIWMLYANLLGNLKDKNGEKAVKMIDVNSCDEQWIPWFVDIYIENPTGLHMFLKGKGIGTRTVYPPLNSQPCYPHLNNTSYPVSEAFSKTGLWLPSSSALSNEQIARVCQAVGEYYRGGSKL